MKRFIICLVFPLMIISACNKRVPSNAATLPAVGAYTDTIEGRPAGYYVLKSKSGMQAAICTYGARLVGLVMASPREGTFSILTGLDSLRQYGNPINAHLGLLLEGGGCKHWDAIQRNDSTLELFVRPFKISCQLEGSMLHVSGNCGVDSLLPVPGITIDPGAVVNTKRIHRICNGYSEVILDCNVVK